MLIFLPAALHQTRNNPWVRKEGQWPWRPTEPLPQLDDISGFGQLADEKQENDMARYPPTTTTQGPQSTHHGQMCRPGTEDPPIDKLSSQRGNWVNPMVGCLRCLQELVWDRPGCRPLGLTIAITCFHRLCEYKPRRLPALACPLLHLGVLRSTLTSTWDFPDHSCSLPALQWKSLTCSILIHCP